MGIFARTDATGGARASFLPRPPGRSCRCSAAVTTARRTGQSRQPDRLSWKTRAATRCLPPENGHGGGAQAARPDAFRLPPAVATPLGSGGKGEREKKGGREKAHAIMEPQAAIDYRSNGKYRQGSSSKSRFSFPRCGRKREDERAQAQTQTQTHCLSLIGRGAILQTPRCEDSPASSQPLGPDPRGSLPRLGRSDRHASVSREVRDDDDASLVYAPV